MARSGMAAEGSSLGPRREKRPDTAAVGGQAGHRAEVMPAQTPIPKLFACPNYSTLNTQLPAQLRVALVDSDQGAHTFVRNAFEAHGNGWVLESHLTAHSLLGSVGCVRATPHAPQGQIRMHHETAQRTVLPDVMLMEIRLPGLSGIECLRRVRARRPSARILLFTACSDPETIIESVAAGASGYLIKPVEAEQLVSAVREAAQDRLVFCGGAQVALVHLIQRMGAAKRCMTLSCREREVMLLLVNGATNKDLARQLGIGEGTAHWHVSEIFRKMHVHSREEARRKFVGGGVNRCSSGGA